MQTAPSRSRSFTDPAWCVSPGEGMKPARERVAAGGRQVTRPSVPHLARPASAFKPALSSFFKAHTQGGFCLFSGEPGQLRERAMLLSRRRSWAVHGLYREERCCVSSGHCKQDSTHKQRVTDILYH